MRYKISTFIGFRELILQHGGVSLSGEVFDLASISDNCDKQANYNMPIRDAVIERKRERAAEEERRRRRRGFGLRVLSVLSAIRHRNE